MKKENKGALSKNVAIAVDREREQSVTHGGDLSRATRRNRSRQSCGGERSRPSNCRGASREAEGKE